MKIIKVIADSRPHECVLCPFTRNLEQNRYKCGEITKVKDTKWEIGYRAPDHRCIIEIKE